VYVQCVDVQHARNTSNSLGRLVGSGGRYVPYPPTWCAAMNRVEMQRAPVQVGARRVCPVRCISQPTHVTPLSQCGMRVDGGHGGTHAVHAQRATNMVACETPRYYSGDRSAGVARDHSTRSTWRAAVSRVVVQRPIMPPTGAAYVQCAPLFTYGTPKHRRTDCV
jgi:hypothetical protein